MDVIFGNPGTVEEGFLAALSHHPEIRYIFGLQESVVAGMADGYARVTHRPAVVQVHSAVGLGNAMAMLYQAHRSFTPMVVFAGEVDTRLQAFDGFLGGDLVEIARPVTKWSARVLHGPQLLRMWRRAVKVAMTPPQGPVFLALPMSVLDEVVEPDVHETSAVNWHVAPPPAAVETIAKALVDTSNPLILIGDNVALAGAQGEVRQLSELVGAPVYGVDFGDLSASFKDPLFLGLVGHGFGEQTRAITLEATAVLAVGTPLFPELFPSLKPYFRADARLFQIDLNPWEIAKNYAVELGLLADPKAALQEITQAVLRLSTPESQQKAQVGRQRWSAHKRAQRAARQQAFDAVWDRSPMSASRMAEVVVACLPGNALVYDEAITSSDELLHFLEPSAADSYFLGRGGCLGVGWPGAIGAKLARPDRPVLALSGDGSALYIIQALWTAAREKLDIVFLVCNNRSYRILKVNLLHYWAERQECPGPFPFMDLTPEVRFDKLAEGFGVPGCTVVDAESLRAALESAFSSGGPHLIDVLIDGSVSEEVRMLIRSHSGCA
jgi:benzoylformate decarboxylase